MKAAIYVRVSTGRQAEGELSLPDQAELCRRWCEGRGWQVADVFEDAGYSATSDDRPALQAMLAEAKAAHHPFDAIVVHSQSRFARSLPDLLLHQRALERAKVSLVSITQDFGEGDAAPMMRAMIGIFDEHQSRETAKHVRRSMLENARQGFWNGAAPPYGYRTYVAERRGKKEKKRLEANPAEAAVVRRAFALYCQGDGRSGPMGTKKVVTTLNADGHRNRQGKPFTVQFLGKMLRNEAYIGEHWFNKRDSKTGQERTQSEWIKLAVPPLVDETIFQLTQDKLDRQHPLRTAPRITTSDVLLTGLANCSACGGPMRIGTGKSKSGKVYRYYRCARKADASGTACLGSTVREDKLDAAVTSAVLNHALSPERLAVALPPLIERLRQARSADAESLRSLRERKAALSRKRKRLWDLIGEGELELDAELRAALAELKTQQDSATRQLARIEAGAAAPLAPLTTASTERFADALRRRLADPGAPAFRRAYLRTLIGSLSVSRDSAVISGPDERLATAAADFAAVGDVRIFAREWRTGEDSNPRPPDS